MQLVEGQQVPASTCEIGGFEGDSFMLAERQELYTSRMVYMRPAVGSVALL